MTEAWLVIFDERPQQSRKERMWTRRVDLPDGKRMVVLGAGPIPDPERSIALGFNS